MVHNFSEGDKKSQPVRIKLPETLEEIAVSIETDLTHKRRQPET